MWTDEEKTRFFDVISDFSLSCDDAIFLIKRGLDDPAALDGAAGKKKVGRPRSIDNVLRGQIIDCRKLGMTQELIAYEVGVSLSSVKRILKESKDTLYGNLS